MKKNKLDWHSETKEIDGEEKEIFFLVHEDGTSINLSSIINDEIIEIFEIFNDDLIFISADEYTESELVGIYSFKQKKVIFPFIINDFNTADKSGLIHINCVEGSIACENVLELDLNPDNDFAYLHSDGSVFQNEGIIVEKIDANHYILEDKILSADWAGIIWSYKLYNRQYDTEDCIGHQGILSYDFNKEKKTLNLEFRDEKYTTKELIIQL